MAISCFFCENLLSDYMENFLPPEREKEIREHLVECEKCSSLYEKLRKGVEILNSCTKKTISEELAIEIADALNSRRYTFFEPRKVSRYVITLLILILIAGIAVINFSDLFPFVDVLSNITKKEKFVRYYPLLNGASSVIEEQSHWLRSSELTKSFWQDNSLSPMEFEETFLKKSTQPMDESE